MSILKLHPLRQLSIHEYAKIVSIEAVAYSVMSILKKTASVEVVPYSVMRILELCLLRQFPAHEYTETASKLHLLRQSPIHSCVH